MKRVGIIILAYNKLNYTKITISSLIQHTPDIYDLVVVDNGSSDGTWEYLLTQPIAHRIRFETNVGGDIAFNTALMYVDNEYTAFLNNDLVLTDGWLTNLMAILEADKRNGFTVPASNYASNWQVVPTDYKNRNELQVFARSYNHSDPRLWEERHRLMPYCSLFRTRELKEIGGLDERFSPGGFDDDDLSWRYRRAGYKLIFAKDTYVHHYGSITLRDEDSSIFKRNRGIFRDKYGLDAWDAMAIDLEAIKAIDTSKTGRIEILGIGNTCGATALQMKNMIKANGNFDVGLSYYSTEPKYLMDLMTICDHALSYDPALKDVRFQGLRYDVIYLDTPTNINSLREELGWLKGKLNPNGEIVFRVSGNQNGILDFLGSLGLKVLSTTANLYTVTSS